MQADIKTMFKNATTSMKARKLTTINCPHCSALCDEAMSACPQCGYIWPNRSGCNQCGCTTNRRRWTCYNCGGLMCGLWNIPIILLVIGIIMAGASGVLFYISDGLWKKAISVLTF